MSVNINLVDVLARRSDSASSHYREYIETILENRFIQRHDHFDYALLPDMVLSTIAIAISSNGALVASTHGDHTVKIFQHDTGKFIHSFQGHPRTPWTVKFHPTDANFVASGCLGCEVRVWDIRNRICRAYIRLGFSIISLSFQPNGGAHIGIASGPQLLLWDWQISSTPVQDDVMYRPSADAGSSGAGARGLSSNQITYPNQVIEPVLVHSRNIRAIIFHPLGTLAFAAAPDPPRQANTAPSPCRLYSCECPLMGNKNNVRHSATDNMPAYVPPPLDSMPTLIPQIHLYSDGGLDISADGEYIFACTMMATKKFQGALGRRRGSLGNRINVSRTPPMPLVSPSDNCPHHSERRVDRNADTRISWPHNYEDYDSSNSEFTSDSDSDSDLSSGEVASLGVTLSSMALHGSSKRQEEREDGDGHGIGRQQGQEDMLDSRTSRPLAGARQRDDIVLSRRLTHQLAPLALACSHPAALDSLGFSGTETVNGVGSFSRAYWGGTGSADRKVPEGVTDTAVCDGKGRLLFPADPLHPSYPADWVVEERLCLFNISVKKKLPTPTFRKMDSDFVSTGDEVPRDPKTVTITGSFTDADSDSDEKCCTHRNSQIQFVSEEEEHHHQPDPYAVLSVLGQGGGEIDTLQQVRLRKYVSDRESSIDSIHDNMQPKSVPSVTLVQSKHLPGSLMRAVTSMKLSPSGRLGLIGYGVRVNDNVMHHHNPKVACEILDLTADMATCCMMTDDIDEVNIAQFHPVSGSGVLYGTKRGKVRVFSTEKI